MPSIRSDTTERESLGWAATSSLLTPGFHLQVTELPVSVPLQFYEESCFTGSYALKLILCLSGNFLSLLMVELLHYVPSPTHSSLSLLTLYSFFPYLRKTYFIIEVFLIPSWSKQPVNSQSLLSLLYLSRI